MMIAAAQSGKGMCHKTRNRVCGELSWEQGCTYGLPVHRTVCTRHQREPVKSERLHTCAATAAGDWSSPGLAAPEDDALPKFFKTANGVRVQELTVGKGPQAQQGDAVLIDFVLRRANGYFIYGTTEGVSFQPRDVPIGPIKLQLGSGDVIEGLETALVGMRQGSKRRILVPPEAGYVYSVLQPQMPTFATKRQLANHSTESLLFEVELLRVLST